MFRALASVLAVGTALVTTSTLAQVVPGGFVIQTVVGEPLGTNPVAFAFLPDGRILIAEKDLGTVRLAPAPGGLPVAASIIHTIPDVNASGTERGLLGVAVDPGWPARPYVYFYLTHTGNVIHIVMYTASGELSNPASTAILLDSPYVLLDDIPDLFSNHNGGTLRFGPDGYLYASVGDDSRGCDAQDRTILRGKLLRLDVSQMPGTGSGPPPKSALAPSSNPFPGPDPAERLVYAYGLRNPYRFTIDPWSNDVFIGDVGLQTWEEMNELEYPIGAGSNFGWPEFEGPLQDPDPGASDCSTGPFTSPIDVYPNPPGGQVAAVVAGPLYRPNPNSSLSFPRAYNGDLFLCEFYAKWIRRLERTPSGWAVADSVPGQPSATNWASNLGNVADLQTGPDGALYLMVMFNAGNLPRGLHRIVNTLPSDAQPGDELASPPVAAALFHPNPMRVGRGGRLLFSPPRTGQARVKIFDLRGRLVRTLEPELVAVGSRDEGSVTWDGRTDGGEDAVPGVYLYELVTHAGERSSGKIAVVR